MELYICSKLVPSLSLSLRHLRSVRQIQWKNYFVNALFIVWKSVGPSCWASCFIWRNRSVAERRGRAPIRLNTFHKAITEKIDVHAIAKSMWILWILPCTATLMCGRVCTTKAGPSKTVLSVTFWKVQRTFDVFCTAPRGFIALKGIKHLPGRWRWKCTRRSLSFRYGVWVRKKLLSISPGRLLHEWKVS